jgi:SAM-dependent methyltransferase
MDAAVHKTHRAHTDHWWFRARREIFDAVLRNCTELPSKARILDIGPGSGINLPVLEPLGKVTIVDCDFESAKSCAASKAGVSQGDAERLPFVSGSFELVCALDVLEHLDDDSAALEEMLRVTASGGYLLLTVPAWPILWGRQDVLSHHKRRYRRTELKKRLRNSGFAIQRLTFINAILFPAIFVIRVLSRPLLSRQVKGDKSDFDVKAPFGLDSLLFRLFASEANWVSSRNLPFGVSILAVCRKPADL